MRIEAFNVGQLLFGASGQHRKQYLCRHIANLFKIPNVSGDSDVGPVR